MAANIQAMRISDMSRAGKDLAALIPVVYRGANYAVTIEELLSLLTKAALGLDKVDNVADVDKPLSTVVIQALLSKSDSTHVHSATDIVGLLKFIEEVPIVAHNHAIDDIAGLRLALDDKISKGYHFNLSEIDGLADILSTFATKVHGHAIGDIVGLSSVLTDILTAMSERPTTPQVQEMITASASVVAGATDW